MENSAIKQKFLNFGPKMSDLDIFAQKCVISVFLGKGYKKNYCHISNQHPQICVIT